MLSRGVRPVAITEGLFTLQSGYEQTARLLSMHPRPTAICTGNDLLALGALSAIMDAGLRVPQDLSLVGYDDIAYARLAYPPLTTVRQPARDMGATAARLILDRLTGVHDVDRRPVQMVLKTELVVRQSTAPPAAQPHARSARRVRKRPWPEGEPMDEG
jgi:DNA-binding LacI/PurR family transcriptional regulator